MNTKPLLWLSCLVAVTLATSTVNAGQRRGNGNRFVSRPARGGVSRAFVGGNNRFVGGGNRTGNWNGQRFNGQRFVGNRNWSGQRWSNNHWNNNWSWRHHRRNFVFVDVGFPFWGWGYPYYYDYYPYGYYGGGYYGSYNYNYGNGYGYNNGYGNGYGNGYSGGYDAKVAELQRRLANAGYYRGEIDGIFGSRTQYALKAYRHDHPNGKDNNNYGGSPTLRDRPYSPPPTTTEPSPTE
jgi:hypothetical protein